jgi:hypothetical protein
MPNQTSDPQRQVQPQPQIPLIPTQGVSQFMVSVSANDVLVTVGQGRVAVVADSQGNPSALPHVEWLMSLSMSPSSAKALLQGLASSLDAYEKQFGKIPQNPKLQIKTKDIGK